MRSRGIALCVLAGALACSSSNDDDPAAPARNGAPVISGLAAALDELPRNVPVAITVWAADPEGDPLHYTWTVPPGFSIVAGQGTAQVTVETTRFASGLAEVVVSDGAASATAGIYLSTVDGAWGAAALVEDDDVYAAAVPQIAMNAGGEAFAVWSQSDGSAISVWANRYEPGAGWGTAELVEANDTGIATEQQVAIDASGNAIVVWRLGGEIYANEFFAAGGGGWAAPTVLPTGTGAALAPQVAMNSSGTAFAVWEQSNGVSNDVWATRYEPALGWGTAALVETSDGDCGPPRIVVDASGNAIALWRQAVGGRKSIWANRYEAGTGWGNAALVETDDAGDADFPRIAMDASGNAIAVWQQSDGTRKNLMANRYTAGSGWGTTERVEANDFGDVNSLQVAVDPNGNAVAVWQQYAGTRLDLWASHYDPAIGWGAPALLETDDAGHAGASAVAMDASGNAIAVWNQADGARQDVWTNRYHAVTGWGAAALLETDDAGGALKPQIAIDGSGNAIAVWQQSDGALDSIWAARFH